MPISEISGARTSPGLLLKFIIPSLIGALLFLTPIHYDGQQTVLIGIVVGWVRQSLQPILLNTVVLLTVVAAAGGGWYQLFKPDWKESRPALYAMFHVTPVWLALRTAGAIVGIMVLFEMGPEVVWGEDTGRTVFLDIGIPMLVIFFVACLAMPFLTDYGLMEFIGTLARRVFEKVFGLPGRSAIDATASFVSAAPVGLLITIDQYERGYYTAREAAAVATNFSVVSIPFSLLIAQVTKIEHIYFSWYLTVIIACLICALITVRLPPLSRIPDEYYEPVGQQIHESAASDESLLRWGTREALLRARTAPGPVGFLRSAFLRILDVSFGVIGPGLALATLTAIVVFRTPVFDFVSQPIAWLLSLISIPEATAAAPGLIAGFFDQFMPALIAARIDSDLTRFILAGLSVSQLIYMAEIGVLILRSTLPLTFWQLLWVFVLRTIIVFPVFVVAGMVIL